MSYVETCITKGVKFLTENGPFNRQATENFVSKYISDFRPVDQALIIPRFIKSATEEKVKHDAVCQEDNPMDCDTSKNWQRMIYVFESLLQEITNSSNAFSNDSFFNASEIESLKSKLEELNTAISISRAENEARFAEVLFELEDLKTHLFDRKKNFKDLFAGRLVRLVAEDVLNKTIVSKITNSIFEDLPKLSD